MNNTINNITAYIKEAREGAEELINSGDSSFICEGSGMIKVLNRIETIILKEATK